MQVPPKQALHLTAMRKYSIPIIGLCLIVALTTLVIGQRQRIVRLREQLQSQGAQNEQFAALLAEKARLTELVARDAHAEVRPMEPTMELLRLRGQVSQLNRDLAETDELRRQLETVTRENRQLRWPTLNDTYIFSGFDSNSLPEMDVGFPREKVSAELQRVGAKILSEGDTFVEAQTSPAITGVSNGALTIKMVFNFTEGKLGSRRDSQSYSE